MHSTCLLGNEDTPGPTITSLQDASMSNALALFDAEPIPSSHRHSSALNLQSSSPCSEVYLLEKSVKITHTHHFIEAGQNGGGTPRVDYRIFLNSKGSRQLSKILTFPNNYNCSESHIFFSAHQRGFLTDLSEPPEIAVPIHKMMY